MPSATPADAISDLLISRLLERAARAQAFAQERILREQGLTGAQWSVLRELPGTALGMGELAHRAGCQTSNLTPVVDRLARAGWLKRTRTPRDRRSVRVRLTPKGRSVLRRVRGLLQVEQAEVLRGLGPRERPQLCRLLEKFIAGADQFREDAA